MGGGVACGGQAISPVRTGKIACPPHFARLPRAVEAAHRHYGNHNYSGWLHLRRAAHQRSSSDQHADRYCIGCCWDERAQSIRRARSGCQDAAHRTPSAARRPHFSAHGPGVRDRYINHWYSVSRTVRQCADSGAWRLHADHVHLRVHAAEAHFARVHAHRRDSGRRAATHGLDRRDRRPLSRRLDRLRDRLSLAAPALHGHQLDLPRRLRPRRFCHALRA